METKHTPGLWTSTLVTDALAPNYGMDVYGGENWIANVMARADGAERFPNKEVGEANARLIAAAPDLLENLIRCVDRLEENGFGEMSAVVRAKAAITKATTTPAGLKSITVINGNGNGDSKDFNF